eukprot:CAMPEP_0204904692 /NCGR_PEP_ID=MMETSP1397-20131031/5007_1 /ASSEMBLY_ACC=CAM_ASM_000891 /TAXON_ID=49980 /ORGANISM="Climacostomum Climacostomum virens, Strain Stock W-24" /LENGTH=357 /DNA_ID=CAMNT_0052073505 /DNA_START=930 /DNA_END=2003 /DNA_ORIENTATION=+
MEESSSQQSPAVHTNDPEEPHQADVHDEPIIFDELVTTHHRADAEEAKVVDDTTPSPAQAEAELVEEGQDARREQERMENEKYAKEIEDSVTQAIRDRLLADRKQVSVLQENLHKVTEERDKLCKEVERLGEKVTNTETNLIKNIAKFTEKVKTLHQSCDELDKVSDSLELEVQRTENELIKKRTKKAKFAKRIEVSNHLLETKRNQMKEVRASLAQCQDEAQIIKNSLDARRTEKETSTIYQRKVQLRALKKETESLTEEVSKLNEEVKGAQSALTDMTDKINDLSQELGLNAEYARHAQPRANHEVEKLKEKIWKIKKENENLRSENFTAKMEELREELKKQREEGDKLKTQLAI